MASKAPPERTRTARDALREELLRGAATARELSDRAGISEKDVAGHLEHLEKSLHARGERLVMTPASCIACGFAFEKRQRLKKPGRCPECSSTRIDPPTFAVEGGEAAPPEGADDAE